MLITQESGFLRNQHLFAFSLKFHMAGSLGTLKMAPIHRAVQKFSYRNAKKARYPKSLTIVGI